MDLLSRCGRLGFDRFGHLVIVERALDEAPEVALLESAPLGHGLEPRRRLLFELLLGHGRLRGGRRHGGGWRGSDGLRRRDGGRRLARWLGRGRVAVVAKLPL